MSVKTKNGWLNGEKFQYIIFKIKLEKYLIPKLKKDGVMIQNKSIYLEILILEAILGLVKSIKDQSFSIVEAERGLFMPWVPKYLEELKLDSSIIDLIWQGIELDDVKDLCSYDDFFEELETIERITTKILKDRIKKKDGL